MSLHHEHGFYATFQITCVRRPCTSAFFSLFTSKKKINVKLRDGKIYGVEFPGFCRVLHSLFLSYIINFYGTIVISGHFDTYFLKIISINPNCLNIFFIHFKSMADTFLFKIIQKFHFFINKNCTAFNRLELENIFYKNNHKDSSLK